MQKQPPENFCKKAVLKNFAILQVCSRLFFFFTSEYCKYLFWRTSANDCFWKCSWNWENCWEGILTLHKKTGFFNINIRNCENVYPFAFISWLVSFWVCIYIPYFSNVLRNILQTINIYTRVNKKKIKSSRKEYAVRTCFKF